MDVDHEVKEKRKESKKRKTKKKQQPKESGGGGGGGGGDDVDALPTNATSDSDDDDDVDDDDDDDDNDDEKELKRPTESTPLLPGPILPPLPPLSSPPPVAGRVTPVTKPYAGSRSIESLNMSLIYESERFVEAYLNALLDRPVIGAIDNAPLTYESLPTDEQKQVRLRCVCQWHEHHRHAATETCNWCGWEAEADVRCSLCNRQFCKACLLLATGPETHTFTQVRST